MRTVSWRAWLFSLLSAALQLLPFPLAGPVPAWRRLFCWFCLVPLLIAVLSKDATGRRLGGLQAALLGYLCGVAWYAGNCYWIYQTMHIYGALPELASLGILILFALYLGLYHALFAWVLARLHRGESPLSALLAAPFLWVAIELARARITGFPWDLLGYTQVENFLLVRLAPLGGVMLLSFVVAAINAGFAAAALSATTKRRARFGCAATALAVLLSGLGRVAPPADAAGHTATLLQENLKVGAEGRDLVPFPLAEKYSQFRAWSLHPLLPSGAQPATPPRAELIVWPEAPADFATSDPSFRLQLGQLAHAAHAPVIAGSVGVDFDPASPRGYREYGSAAVFAADGQYLGRYDKIHRVPWGEYVPYPWLFAFAGKLISGIGEMEAGSAHTLFPLGQTGERAGVFICYESIFGDEVRQFTAAGANVLVNISDDGWYGDTSAPWQHLDMARMRAIENGRWVLRDTNTGITTAIDPHGRGVFTTPRHVREAFAFPFGYRTGLTFYTRHGDWFAWLCAGITLLFLVMNYSTSFAWKTRGSSPGRTHVN